MQKANCKSVSGHRERGRTNRSGKQDGGQFVAAIFWVGITLVVTFLLWSFAMVLLQAFEH